MNANNSDEKYASKRGVNDLTATTEGVSINQSPTKETPDEVVKEKAHFSGQETLLSWETSMLMVC
jgi:hypothetical protein